MSVPSVVLFNIDIIRFLVDLGIIYAIFLIVSLTLNLEAGYAGVPNFGKVMFVAGGAAIAGSVSGRLSALILAINTHGNYNGSNAQIITQIDSSLSSNPLMSVGLLLLGVLLAAGIGAGLGFLASYPAIRLREDSLGMLLLASAQFFQIFLRGYEPLIGGTQGLEVPDLFGWAVKAIADLLNTNETIGFRDLVVLGVLGVFAGSVYFYFERAVRSPLGRTLRAVRDNEVASRALGKDDVAIRRRVIIIASAISGMAGALLTFYVGSVGAETWTRITWTFWPWVIVIIGGAANNLGVALGAFSFTFLMKVIDQVKFHFQAYLPIDVNWFEYLMFASLLILILMVRPGGILAEKSSITLPRKSVAVMMEERLNFTAFVADQDRSQSIARTKTGLLLLVIGLLMGPIPYVDILGGILVLIGAILVIVGGKPFGQTHSRNTIWSVIIYVVGVAVIIVGSVAFTFSVFSTTAISTINGSFNPNTVSQALSSSFDGLLMATVLGGAIIGIANVFFTYAIQNRNGRILLWSGYLASLAVSAATFLIISPLIASAVNQALSGGTYNPASIAALQFQEYTVGLLGIIPAGLYATAFYLVWSRINRGEIPASGLQAAN